MINVYNGERHQRLLALSLMEDGQIAEAHLERISSVLSVYKKDIDMARFIDGDNCATNQSIEKETGCSTDWLRKPSVEPRG
ncbi:hypothetical protein PC116_g21605 [Phytophthora cactorum]|nr:hypothetical protein PC114_g19148 [Phytophthora cactorum]KAG2983006.1 hypothetical protein PC119_g20687 [Phytophthora cactorum]KAG3000266.1 hypothetical protein PC120_g20739 [Phytophthora cactorum]KAG3154476.1 hypothetical protein PC128_g22341 [Phytophthora cactorum]KAG4230088.1 hypothetical protein PC116_g21605 [Phytophthora cactorum]